MHDARFSTVSPSGSTSSIRNGFSETSRRLLIALNSEKSRSIKEEKPPFRVLGLKLGAEGTLLIRFLDGPLAQLVRAHASHA